MIKLLVFPDNLILISIVKESDSADLGEPDCILINPFIVKNNPISTESQILEPWLSNYTKQKEFKIHSDKILTITEPTARLIEVYDNLIK